MPTKPSPWVWSTTSTPAAGFADRVQAFARHLATLPREAVGLAKVAIDVAATVDRRTAREFDRMAQSLLFSSDEFRNRVAAFARRPPRQ